jgi:hypothetical protein
MKATCPALGLFYVTATVCKSKSFAFQPVASRSPRRRAYSPASTSVCLQVAASQKGTQDVTNRADGRKQGECEYDDDPAGRKRPTKVPITFLTGFLGAGKVRIAQELASVLLDGAWWKSSFLLPFQIAGPTDLLHGVPWAVVVVVLSAVVPYRRRRSDT